MTTENNQNNLKQEEPEKGSNFWLYAMTFGSVGIMFVIIFMQYKQNH